MSNIIKLEKVNGKFIRAVEKRSSKSVKLTCLVTGETRITNKSYLESKANKLNVSIDEIVDNYVSTEGLKQLDTFNHPNKHMLLFLNGGKRKKLPKLTIIK